MFHDMHHHDKVKWSVTVLIAGSIFVTLFPIHAHIISAFGLASNLYWIWAE